MHAQLVQLLACVTVCAVSFGALMAPGKMWLLTVQVFAGLVGGIRVAPG